MPIETYTLVSPLKGFAVGEKFIITRSTEQNYVLNRVERPESFVSISKDMFDKMFKLDTV